MPIRNVDSNAPTPMLPYIRALEAELADLRRLFTALGTRV